MLIRRIGRALLRRCPRCGSRDVFRGWTRLVDTCPGCELTYEREEGYWLGAILINTVATLGLFGAGMLAWALATWPDPPWTAMTATGVGFNLIAPVVLYPFSKTLWIAAEITARPPPGGPQTERM